MHLQSLSAHKGLEGIMIFWTRKKVLKTMISIYIVGDYLTQLRLVRGRSERMVAVRESTFSWQWAPCSFKPNEGEVPYMNTCWIFFARKLTCHSKTAVTKLSLHIYTHLKWDQTYAQRDYKHTQEITDTNMQDYKKKKKHIQRDYRHIQGNYRNLGEEQNKTEILNIGCTYMYVHAQT